MDFIDYKNKISLKKYDLRFEQTFVKHYLLYTLFTLFDFKNKTILDCPCSTGYITNLLIQKGASFVVCSDIVNEQLEYALERFKINNIDEKSYKLIQHDAKEIKLLYKEVQMALVLHLFCFGKTKDELINIAKFIYINLEHNGKLISFHCTPLHLQSEKIYENYYNSKIIEYSTKNKKEGAKLITKDNDFLLPRYVYSNEYIKDILNEAGFKNIKIHKLKCNPLYTGNENHHIICDYSLIEANKV